MHRRYLLRAGLTGLTLAAMPFRGSADGHAAPSIMANPALMALPDSQLIYLSPIKSDGNLSRCQAEIWYAMVGASIYVCTRTDSWRALAPTKGIAKTKIWVGDLGVWKSADYQSLPSITATASIESDTDRRIAALDQFGLKYSAEWSKWGPRFRKGLADGSRTMLRYEIVT